MSFYNELEQEQVYHTLIRAHARAVYGPTKHGARDFDSLLCTTSDKNGKQWFLALLVAYGDSGYQRYSVLKIFAAEASYPLSALANMLNSLRQSLGATYSDAADPNCEGLDTVLAKMG